jgi:hypothetical protein
LLIPSLFPWKNLLPSIRINAVAKVGIGIGYRPPPGLLFAFVNPVGVAAAVLNVLYLDPVVPERPESCRVGHVSAGLKRDKQTRSAQLGDGIPFSLDLGASPQNIG